MYNCCSKTSDNDYQINNSIEVLRAVSEPNRLRILCVLSKEEICVCKLAEELNLAHNLISFHLKTLHDVGILDKKRDGNQIFYFIRTEWKSRINYFFKFINF
jgi:ArsR family transcriptional regulator, arsenate/arsenite/antimonite-responsive transcriptional repressor